mgnify:FL=1
MPKTIKINKEKLKKFYLQDKLGSYEIAKLFNCSQRTIMNYLCKYLIKTRSVQEAKALSKPRYPRKNFNGNSVQKAYLIGFRLGDLHISKTHPNSPTIRISTNTTKNEQLDLVEELFSKYGHVKKYNRDKNGAISIRCFVNNSFNFLLKKEDNVEKWILKNKYYFFSFLGGYVDAEGTFSSKHNTVFSINTQDKKIMHQISFYLNKYGIQCIKPLLARKMNSVINLVKSNKDVWLINIYNKKNLIILIKSVKKYIKHKKRKTDMIMLLNKLQYVRA